MHEYNLCVSISDNTEITNNLYSLILNAANEANSRQNAIRNGRNIRVGDLIDSKHVHITIVSKEEVIPSRALTALSRSVLALDSDNLLDGHCYRGCVFNSSLIASDEKHIIIKNDCELLTTITEMIFGQQTMNNRDKKLSREYTEKLRNLVVDYLNNKTI